jgi:hypothetical protein
MQPCQAVYRKVGQTFLSDNDRTDKNGTDKNVCSTDSLLAITGDHPSTSLRVAPAHMHRWFNGVDARIGCGSSMLEARKYQDFMLQRQYILIFSICRPS